MERTIEAKLTTEYNYSDDGSLLVLASEKFDPKYYLHNFEDFKEFKKIII